MLRAGTAAEWRGSLIVEDSHSSPPLRSHRRQSHVAAASERSTLLKGRRKRGALVNVAQVASAHADPALAFDHLTAAAVSQQQLDCAVIAVA